ncbi:MAG: HlyD family secretion protein [Sedimentisphaerales bacterium]|nr:HlyD family secretion protein [Sedimentisphaerales bacterium]
MYLFRILPYESTDDAFIEGHIITISSRVNGFVNSVDINDNQWVEEGDLLVQLDPRDYQAIVDLKQAALAAAHATAQQSLAGVKAATVESRRAETDYNRYKQIYDANGGITRQMLDNASSAAQAMTAQVEESIKNAAAEEAKIAQARADAALAMLNLSYSKIYAPQRGKVTNKTVEIGEYVSVGQPLMSIVPEKVWIIANFKETQLEYMKPGQSVKIKIDAYPQRIFKGHIDSIQAGTGAVFSLLPAENATGNYIKVVQRVPVKIVFDEDPNATSILSPGMSVLPEVKVK